MDDHEPQTDFDILVVGGGINGCGIARDAAGRGFSVCLAEMDDLASGTSSWSTKLIHGGLRYLEHREFRLVREALLERAVLWRLAPHVIGPLRFVLPHAAGMRPAWLLRLGLFLYDRLGGAGALPPTRTLNLRADPAGRPLKDGLARAFEYSDCRVDDSRLVVLNARDAADRGADIRTRTRVVAAGRRDGAWSVTLAAANGGERRTVRARVLVNAAGPWVDAVLADALGKRDARNVRLVQGSHIVVPRKFDHDRAYIFQNPDGRIVFAIPYEDDFTLIGTTDLDYRGDPGACVISEAEVAYLCDAAGAYFREPVSPDDVVWSFSGVRPLRDDGATTAQEATRDYVLEADGDSGGGGGGPVLFNIFGGKITTYRRLAEAMVARIEGVLGRRGRPWTADAPLPGGDFPAGGRDALRARLEADYPFLTAPLARRLVRQYGTLAWDVLGDAASAADLGTAFGAGLYQREAAYLMDREWAVTAADVLWRRTKLGLRVDAEAAARLDTWMRDRRRDARRRVA